MFIWQAESCTGKPKQGMTSPHFFDCASPSGDENAEFLLKPVAANIQAREMLGAWIAAEFGIQTPEPAIVEISPDAMPSVQAYFDCRTSFCPFKPGFYAGSRKVPLLANLKLEGRMDSDLLPQAFRIFAFDMLAAYGDRTPNNPNIALLRGELVLFDFERGFGEEPHEAVAGGPPWTAATRGYAQLHCLYPSLKRQPIPADFISEALARIASPQWRQNLPVMPPAWSVEVERIMAHIDSVRHNVELFEQDLSQVLQ